MKKKAHKIEPDWHWDTPEGSREFDRSVDRGLTFRETLEWLEEAETLALRMTTRSWRLNSRGRSKDSETTAPDPRLVL